MKKAIYAIMCVMLLTMVFSCSNGDGGNPDVKTFTGEDAEGTQYTLIITDDSTYEFLIDGESFSTGKAAKDGDTWVCTPFADEDSPFVVTVSEDKIFSIEGDITPDDGSAPIPAPEFIQVEPVTGVWTWALSDDAETNEHITPQTVFTPGGASRFADGGYVEDPAETDRYDNPVKRPFVYPAGTVKDNNDKVINAEVFNFKGNTKVSAPNRPGTSGAQFPLLGWEAVPDDETLELLKTAYSYSFRVRLNSSTASNWAFVTSIVTDYEPEKGYEHKHWYGNQKGDSGGTKTINNFTNGLNLGVWYKITVVINKDSSGFNINQDAWMHQYIPASPAPAVGTPAYDKDQRDQAAKNNPYDQSAAQKLQWQIPLQHQVGAGVTMRNSGAYDAIDGSYDFDIDFYGLELNMN
ncbi:MAG: hypothetical protein LBH43_09910 [Treponema sp.]|jgi:hypothetical protein|nr:hypothetical protein [Treponema sp.]